MTKYIYIIVIVSFLFLLGLLGVSNSRLKSCQVENTKTKAELAISQESITLYVNESKKEQREITKLHAQADGHRYKSMQEIEKKEKVELIPVNCADAIHYGAQEGMLINAGY